MQYSFENILDIFQIKGVRKKDLMGYRVTISTSDSDIIAKLLAKSALLSISPFHYYKV